jgi:hypothetical protein
VARISSLESLLCVTLIFVLATGLAALAVMGLFVVVERWLERRRGRR